MAPDTVPPMRTVSLSLLVVTLAAVGTGAAVCDSPPELCGNDLDDDGDGDVDCDDPDCRVEWFHTQCVAISRSAMPSTWVCAECARRRAVMPGAGAVPAAAAGATAGAAPRGRSVASPDGGSAR